jgi:hypothetical protein
MVAAGVYNKIDDVTRPHVHSPLNLLPVRLAIGVRLIGPFEQGLGTPRTGGQHAHDEIHAVPTNGPYLQ